MIPTVASNTKNMIQTSLRFWYGKIPCNSKKLEQVGYIVTNLHTHRSADRSSPQMIPFIDWFSIEIDYLDRMGWVGVGESLVRWLPRSYSERPVNFVGAFGSRTRKRAIIAYAALRSFVSFRACSVDTYTICTCANARLSSDRNYW